jgi:hypothetical protein
MKNVLLALAVFASLGSSRPGCNPYKPKRETNETPHKVPEICTRLDHECFQSCFRRQASYSCAVCCDENSILCRNNEKYDFAPCELIDPAKAPSPDAGTGDAGSSTAQP